MTCTNISTNEYSVFTHKQSVCGQVPDSAVFKLHRRVSGKSMVTQSFIESSETKVSRQAKRQLKDTKEFVAEIEFVLTEDVVSYLENFYYATFNSVQVISATDFSFNSTTGVISSVIGGLSVVTPGTYVFFEDDSSLMTGAYYVQSVVDDNSIIVNAENISQDASAVSGVFKTSFLRSGKEKKYLAIQTRVYDESGVNQTSYETVENCLVGDSSITIGESGEITGNISLVGTGSRRGAYPAQTDSPEDTSDVLLASQSLKRIILNHQVNTDAGVKDFSLEFGNNLTTTNRAGSVTSNVVTEGNITCSGTLNTIVSKANTWGDYDKYLNGDSFSITIPLELDDTKRVYVTVGRAIFTQLDRPDSGNELQVNSGTYTAEECELGYTVQIDKNF